MTLYYRIVTVFGDQFFSAAEPIYSDGPGGSRVDSMAYHVTSGGWQGMPKRITLPALIVRYVEHGEWELFGDVPRFDPPLERLPIGGES